jgi:hypothetical protein
MTKETKAKELKAATEIATLVMGDERVTNGVSVDAGVVSVSDEAVSAAFEHAGVDAKQFKKDQKAVKEAALGIIEVAGEKSIDSFHGAKDLSSTNGVFRMGHDEYAFEYEREAEVKMGVGPEAPTKKVFARANVKIKSTVGSTTIKSMKERLAAAGLKKYGN